MKYSTLESLELQVIDPSKTQKNGLMRPSKFLDPSTRAPSNPPTAWQITSSASTKTQSLQLVKPSEYQSANL